MKNKGVPDCNLITKYWQERLIKILTSPLIFILPPSPPLSWWKRWWRNVKWRTVGRFKTWLHRDCDW